MTTRAPSPSIIDAYQVDDASARIIGHAVPEGEPYDTIAPAALSSRVHAATATDTQTVLQPLPTWNERSCARPARRSAN